MGSPFTIKNQGGNEQERSLAGAQNDRAFLIIKGMEAGA
jgi:hypothetical protein